MAPPLFDTVYILTGEDACPLCEEYGSEHAVFDDPAELMDNLMQGASQNVALFVEVKYYMQLGPEARNRVTAVARDFPLFRISFDPTVKAFQLIDKPENSALEASFGPRTLRSEERTPVELNIYLAQEEDPFLQHAVRANLLNVSHNGAFICCVENEPFKGFCYIRILELANPRPIYCNIRWKRPWGVHDKLPGIGVRFIDIQEEQLRELQTIYIEPFKHGKEIA